jgi:DNA-directed RNA polymerase specialized sigma24 family protein
MSDEPFITHRSLLFSVAYETLGSAADAEDVVKETSTPAQLAVLRGVESAQAGIASAMSSRTRLAHRSGAHS